MSRFIRKHRFKMECRPVGATVLSERDEGHRVTRRLRCHRCGTRWIQHRYA